MDPCAFWKAFCDVTQPNPLDVVPESELDDLMVHGESCEPCAVLVLPMLARIEDAMNGGALMIDETLDARAAQLLMLALQYLLLPTKTEEP